MEEEFTGVIAQARALIGERKYAECEALLCTAMFQHPHDPVPHNLMGLLLEHQRRHTEAMKHFRAAYALDPTYPPASWNMECFAGLYKTRSEAFYACECDKSLLPEPYVREEPTCT